MNQGRRKVVTVVSDQSDGSLSVLVEGHRQPIDEFLRTHTPVQVGGLAASSSGSYLVGLMIVEENG